MDLQQVKTTFCMVFYMASLIVCGAAQNDPSGTLLNYMSMISGLVLGGPGSQNCDPGSPLRSNVTPIAMPALYPDLGLYVSARANGAVLLDIVLGVGEDEPGVIRATPHDFVQSRSNPGIFDENFLKSLSLSDLEPRGKECDRVYHQPQVDMFVGTFPNCSARINGVVPVHNNTIDCNSFQLDIAIPSGAVLNFVYKRCNRYPLPAEWTDEICFDDVCADQ